MLEQVNIENVLFLDIETTPQYPVYEELPEKFQHLWEKKSTYFREQGQTASEVYDRAGIYAEFGKIICISVGMFYQKKGELRLRVKSYADHDEKKMLYEFANMLGNYTSHGNIKLCAHNGQEFDFPYIARRCLINAIPIPKILDMAGAKPWEVKDTLLDTLQLWKFGDYKHYTSLELLCAIFDIPTPKDDIDGSQVATVYWKENDLDRIIKYCEKDVFALAQLFLRYQGKPILPPSSFESV
ncbi:MAG TPA: 3'-5' exonuclease [Prolixibacteraceae bacterium]|nr:3'-5' exonuclease [Prolixibacteraceae bacterium]HPS14106.1 3'-5' exonuclease [Prolixibacteraceae bacterium]